MGSQATQAPKRALSREQEAHGIIVGALDLRKRLLRSGSSRRPVDYTMCIARVEQWTKSYPYPSQESLRRFIDTHATDLDRLFVGNKAGDNARMRLMRLIQR